MRDEKCDKSEIFFAKCSIVGFYKQQEADIFKVSANMPYICSKKFETS